MEKGQRARVEQWAGSGRRVGSTWCGRRREVEEQEAGRGVSTWVETRRWSQEKETDRTGKRDCPDIYRAHSSGGGAMPNTNAITRIRRSNWPRPLTWPASLRRKPPQFVSGKATPNSGNIALRTHEMT